MPGIKFETVDEYISSFPENKQLLLNKIRNSVKQAVPLAEEVISYNMPAFKFHGVLLYFAAHKEHIGIYPANAKLINQLRDDLKGFETSKGTIKFPVSEPLPIDLIKHIAKMRAGENLEKSKKNRK